MMATTYLSSILLTILVLLDINTALCQGIDRIDRIKRDLHGVAEYSPGLHQEIELSVSGISVHEFLRALAETAELNIHISEGLSQVITNNFQGESALNVLVFLAIEYDLDYSVIGSIITVKPYNRESDQRRSLERRIHYEESTGNIKLELNNDSLQSVSKIISQITGRNVIVSRALRDSLVTLFVENLSLKHALSILAFNNKVKLMETVDSTFVLLPLSPGEINHINPGAAPGTMHVSQTEGQDQALRVTSRESDTSEDKMISVDAIHTPIVEIIKNAAAQTSSNFFIYDEIQGIVSATINDVKFGTLLDALLKGTDYTYRLKEGIYTIGRREQEGLRQVKVIPLQHRSLDTIQAIIPAEWKKGVEILEFREQNTLLIAGSAPQIQEISTLIEELDKRVPMILIEVNMVDIRKGNEVKTGISMGVSDSVKTGGTIFPGPDYTFGARDINHFLSTISTGSTFNLGRVAPNFYVQLSALEQNNNVEIRSVPKLSTLNGHSASLSIGNSRYFSVSTQNVLGTMNPHTVVTESFTQVDANMTIDIKPIVSGDEQVTMTIKIDISDFTQDTPINQPPPTTTSKFESIIRIKNEETVVLGGIERVESSQSGSGFPILSRIPLIKWLFSSRSKSQNKVVSIVFIKPTIIYH